MHLTDSRWTKVFPPVFLCALLWGSAFPGIKTVYQIWEDSGAEISNSERWWFAGLRFFIAGIALLLVAKKPWKQISKAPKLSLLRFTLLQTTGQYVLFYWGLAYAAGSVAGLLTASGSFWWMLFAPILLKTNFPSAKQWLAVLIGATGLAIATFQGNFGGHQVIIGSLLILSASAVGSIGIIEFTKLKPHIGARTATGFSLAVGGILLLALGWKAFAHVHELLSCKVIMLTLWLAFVSAAAFSLWNYLSTIHPVPLLAGYRFLIPLAGMIESLIFLQAEKIHTELLIGAIIIGAGVFLSQRWSSASHLLAQPKKNENAASQ